MHPTTKELKQLELTIPKNKIKVNIKNRQFVDNFVKKCILEKNKLD